MMSSNALQPTYRPHLAFRSSSRRHPCRACPSRGQDGRRGIRDQRVVTSTIGPNDAKGQPASVLTFTDDEVKKLHDGHYSAALLFQTSSDWADAVT
jgi:hypothetical protein